MSDTEIRELFEAMLANPAPDTTDIEAAIRAGDRRRKHRVTTEVLSSAAAVVLIGVVLAWTIPNHTGAPPTNASASPVQRVPLAGDLVTDNSQLLRQWHAVK